MSEKVRQGQNRSAEVSRGQRRLYNPDGGPINWRMGHSIKSLITGSARIIRLRGEPGFALPLDRIEGAAAGKQ